MRDEMVSTRCQEKARRRDGPLVGVRGSWTVFHQGRSGRPTDVWTEGHATEEEALASAAECRKACCCMPIVGQMLTGNLG